MNDMAEIEISLLQAGKPRIGSHATIHFNGDAMYLTADPYGVAPAEACKEAAKLLRQAADRFDALAKESAPHSIETHHKINQSE